MKKSTYTPFIVIAILLLVLFAGKHTPLNAKSFFYAISLSIQSLLMAILPFLIFTFLFNSIASFKKNAVIFLLLVMFCICLSNFTYTMIAYFFNSLNLMGEVKIIATSKDKLEPYWAAMNLQIIPNNIALIAGILCGLSVNIIKKSDKLQDISTKLVGISLFILNKIFIPIIPLFVLGFAFKLQHDEILVPILKDYSIVLINVLIPAILYLALMYYISNDCNAKKALSSIKNMLPAFLTGLTTMSGAAAIPSSLIASEKNTKNPTLCRSIIPMTSNIHLLGDGFFIPMVSLAILTSFGYNIPDINHYLVFAFSFMLAKFAVAGVPAGGILVMLPVLKSTLGFDEEMLCLIMSIYIIFDPITTSINVLGNGGFVMMIVKCYNKIQFNFLTSK